jgi:hypothetical protein
VGPKVAALPDDVVVLPTVRVPNRQALPANIADGTAPDFRGLTLRAALKRANKFGILPRLEGWGRVISQTPLPGAPLDPQEPMTLMLSPATRGALFAEEPSIGSAL